MKSFHLDPVGGIAGDMFIAAILDIRPDLEAGLRETLSRCPLIDDVSVAVVEHNDGVLAGRRFLVDRADDRPETPPHRHPHGHHDDHHRHDHAEDETHHRAHDHVAWRDIRSALETAQIDAAVIRHAIGIFALLAEAEAKVHGTAPDEISFHEVGAWDSIADIVGAACLIAQLDAATWTVGPLPLGSGRVRTAHGLLPVPAPATALLMQDFATIDDGIGGERVTPTGAAILRYLCREPAPPSPRTLVTSGHGFGTRTLPGISNCLRILCFETMEDVVTTETIAVIEFETDDQTGEDLAHGIDHLRAQDGVLDVVQAPVFGKKGRMMAHVRVLTRANALQAVARRVFEETSTIGIRHSLVQRLMLPREAGEIQRDGKSFRTKTAIRPGGPTMKIEADDLADITGKSARDTIRRTVEMGDKTEDAG
ncbi:MAG TPA: LarC family nickel insertion protein [Pararhizobium sp.]|uniref:LarC family nickel insertion protein n=1 Tax=Pararhizobium sp. TaxID=1977563 RepID=UPI002C6B11C5|nr:LarC family nickel insertion protein [Pararhizobium sp.]HTO30937.1 LarC family nickel insertion protein [Pararhizobium sp.]